jgi:hypothetical protein
VHFFLGQAQRALGAKPRARAAFEQALKIDPGYEPALRALEQL